MHPILFNSFGFIILIAAVLVLIRLIRGPSLPDRIVAFDLLAALLMIQLVICAYHFENPFLLEIALVISLLAFLASIAITRYIERRT